MFKKKTDVEKLAEQYLAKKEQETKEVEAAVIVAKTEKELSVLTHMTFDTYEVGHNDYRIIKIRYNPETLECKIEGTAKMDSKVTHKSLDLAKQGLDSQYLKSKGKN